MQWKRVSWTRALAHRERYRTCVLCNFISRLLSHWLREFVGLAFLLRLHLVCACVCMAVRRPYLWIPTIRIYCMNERKRSKECVSVGADKANNKHTAEHTTFHIKQATTTAVALATTAPNVFYFVWCHFEWSSTKNSTQTGKFMEFIVCL